MQTKVFLQKVMELCQEPLTQRGLTLWDVTFEKEGPRYMLTVIIDKPAGVDIDDCEFLSRAIDPQLDAPIFDTLPPYTLCVSSAGLERVLRTPAHFAWAQGRKIELTFYKPHDGAKNKIGVLEHYDQSSLTVDGQQYTLEEVAGCREYYDFTSINDR